MILKWILIALVSSLQPATCDEGGRVITTLKYSRHKHRLMPTMVNGIPAAIGQMSYLVSIKEPLHKVDDVNYIWHNLCGGSIISKNRVLTAAHCFEDNGFYFKKNPSNLRVVAGNLETEVIHPPEDSNTNQGQWREIKKVIIHHAFLFPQHDISIAFLKKDFDYGKDVNWVSIARSNMDYRRNCVAAGYGLIRAGAKAPESSALLYARIDVMPQSKCSYIWEVDMKNFICTESVVSDVNKGDSGGPLVCKGTSDPEEIPGRQLLVGVVSGKNYDKTTLFTRVSAYHDWIMSDGMIDSTADLLKTNFYFVFFIIICLVFVYVCLFCF